MEMNRERDAIREKVSGRARPKVLVVVDRLPGTLRDVYIATGESYLTELVEIAGGEPIRPEAPLNYMKLSTEALVVYDYAAGRSVPIPQALRAKLQQAFG